MPEPNALLEEMRQWIGRTTRAEDVVTERLDQAFRATLEPFIAQTAAGEAPPGLHWCLAPAIAPASALGTDGHPAKTGGVPPIPLPRRMWAGGEVTTHDRLRVGDRVTRISRIADIQHKQGRSGELWFLTMQHDHETGRGLAIRERQDIVYRAAAGQRPPDASPGAAEEPRPRAKDWTIATSAVQLFRYSAITFNGHRIHYDYPYATEVEGYDGLVVHGPMQATWLLNLASAELGRIPESFSYRGVAPAIAGDDIAICRSSRDGSVFWSESNGRIRMEARAQ